MDDSPQHPEDEKPPSIFQIGLSVMAAALGVQTSANRKRDFGRGSPLAFILGGLLFTAFFVLTLILIVSLVLES